MSTFNNELDNIALLADARRERAEYVEAFNLHEFSKNESSPSRNDIVALVN